MSTKFPIPCVALDIETTDLDPEKGEIIEIGAVKFQDEKNLGEFQSLINPGIKIPTLVTSITGISNEEVKNAPTFQEIKDEFAEFVGEAPICGHNIYFDLKFLKAKGLDFKNPRFDTWKLASILLPHLHTHSLESLASFLKMKHLEAHRALDDAKASWELFLFLIKKIYEIDDKILSEACQILEKSKWDLKDVFCQINRLKKIGPLFAARKQLMGRRIKVEKKVEPQKKTIKDIHFDIDKITAFFDEKGELAHQVKHYESRPGQIKMMKEVALAFEKQEHLMCEAGPGLDKSLAYLMASLFLAKSKKERVVVSVYTDKLCRQITDKDIPLLEKIIPFKFNWAKIFRREQYLCRRRFSQFKKQTKLDEDEICALIKILLWIPETVEGLFSEITFTHNEAKVKEKVSAAKEFCLGRRCSFFNQCFYYQSKKRTDKADIVIIDHSLLCASAAGLLEKLDYNYLVVDEAHCLEEAGTSCLSQSLSYEKVLSFLSLFYAGPQKQSLFRRISQKIILEKNRLDLSKQTELLDRLVHQFALFFGICGTFIHSLPKELSYQGRTILSLDKETREYENWWKIKGAVNTILLLGRKFLSNLEIIELELKKFKSRVRNIESLIQDFKGSREKIKEIFLFLEEIILNPKKDFVYWLYVSPESKINFYKAPLGLASFFSENLFKKKKSIILVSQIFSLVDEFEYFRKRLGLISKFKKVIIPSQFEYKKRVLIFIPQNFPYPEKSGFNEAVGEVIDDIASKISGKCIALFTSYASIKTCYKKLALDLKKKGVEVLAQGISGGKERVLERFVDLKSKAILLCTFSFLERVYLAGGYLKCLIIVKLPFEPPLSPVFTARSATYKNGFTEYALPQALFRFKQGFQTLVRSIKDKGVLVCLDRRIESEEYGLKFIQVLPEVGIEYGKKERAGAVVKSWVRS